MGALERANLRLARTEAEEAYEAAFETAGVTAEWRRAAFARFSDRGLPTRRVEDWHYTDLRQNLRSVAPFREPDFAAIEAARERVARSPWGDAHALVVLDGVFLPSLSARDLPAGVSVRPLNEALLDPGAALSLQAGGLGEADSVVALNAALMQDGVWVEVAEGVELEAPLVLFNLLSKGAAHSAFSRSLFRIGAGAKARIVEFNENAGDVTQSNDALVLEIGDEAEVAHVVDCEYGGAESVSLQSVLATLGVKTQFDSFAFVRDSGLLRRQLFVRLAGDHARLGLGGLSLLRGREHADTTLIVDHAAPACESREFYRHIVDDEATGVYQGKVCVRQIAQKTDGGMKSQALVLSEGGVMFNKPELEIFADDVVCGHGATVGQLDEEQVFYLRARGLSLAEAEALLLEAFANEALERIADEALREPFEQAAREWLLSRSGAKS